MSLSHSEAMGKICSMLQIYDTEKAVEAVGAIYSFLIKSDLGVGGGLECTQTIRKLVELGSPPWEIHQ